MQYSQNERNETRKYSFPFNISWGIIYILICFHAVMMVRRLNGLTHWGRGTHICVNNLTIIGSDNGLSPDRRQAIIWTNAGKVLIGPLGINFSENLIGIQTFSFYKMHLKMSSAKWRPFCFGLNVLTELSEWPACIEEGLTYFLFMFFFPEDAKVHRYSRSISCGWIFWWK